MTGKGQDKGHSRRSGSRARSKIGSKVGGGAGEGTRALESTGRQDHLHLHHHRHLPFPLPPAVRCQGSVKKGGQGRTRVLYNGGFPFPSSDFLHSCTLSFKSHLFVSFSSCFRCARRNITQQTIPSHTAS